MNSQDENFRSPAYSEEFFDRIKNGSFRSAEVVAPLVLDIVHPQSVVDVGCGTGAWLVAFCNRGISDVFGIDGNSRGFLDIPAANFKHMPLHEPFSLGRRFDLAISLEVAEHLPSSRADGFIRDLISLAPVVLFSAAVPGQTGTDHQNEQWPDYWAARFALHSYMPMDCLRKKIWDDPRVEWWYRQNILIYVEKSFAERHRLNLDSRKPRKLIRPEYRRLTRRPSIVSRAIGYLAKSIR